MKILACSDIHIGRIPAIPGQNRITGSSAWEAVVQKALDLHPDALVLAGDVVEKDNSWFEAYGAFIKGLDRLKAAEIAVFAIAGNHDSQVFPRLAKDSQAIRLLGLHGKWEAIDYNGVRFIGWSFPDHRHAKNPVSDFPAEFQQYSGHLLGILHCDLDASIASSHYAPVPSQHLSTSPIPFWILGHIHAGGLRADGHALYCGSPYALDSSETGTHGVWLLETQAGNRWKTPEFIPLSPWRFTTCQVKLDPTTTKANLPERITHEMRALIESQASQGFVGTLFCRLEFIGTVSAELDLSRALPQEELVKLEIPHGEASIRLLGDYDDHTQLAVYLESLSQGVGPIAMLAKLLIDMDGNTDLVREVRMIDSDSFNTATFRPLQNSSISGDQEYKETIRNAGRALLRAMLNQLDQRKES